jgi:hypothetical protein
VPMAFIRQVARKASNGRSASHIAGDRAVEVLDAEWRSQSAPDGAAKESNLPSVGLPRPAGFEGRMGHQALAAPG